MYPTKKQETLLLEILDHHRLLYNSALKERIDAYKTTNKFISRSDQEKQLTEIRKEFPEYKKFNSQSQQRTLKRLDLAFQNFFRRIRNGETPGFPRFKFERRFTSFGFNSHGDGYKLLDNGKLRISGVGQIKLRGKSLYSGEPKESQVLYRDDKWYFSLTLETCSRRNNNDSKYDVIFADWGIKNILTLAKISNLNTPNSIEYEEISNPKFLNKYRTELEKIQSKRDKTKHKTCKRRKLTKKYRALNRKIRNIRGDFQNKLSNRLAKLTRAFVTEKLNVKGMVEGEIEKLGKNNKGLHRNILDSAPASLFSKIRYKVEETGSEYRELDTRTLKPTQRCSECWKLVKKGINDRVHECSCGYKQGRDRNAVRVMAKHFIKSQELALKACL